MAQVELKQVEKHFGDKPVLLPTDLIVENGEFLTLLGPSGCGKTTTLRLIAGFISPTSGRVTIGTNDVTDLPPQKREIGMVFQDYALFPHLTIAENIGFGLVERKVKRAEIDRRVCELLNLIRLPGVQNRYPAELSGGQQQRVAVARAVAHPPRVLLMDEPLGALDLKLREAMQVELRRIQKELSITTVYVTHDQIEAMTMSDRIAVMNGGRIEQLGTAEGIYNRPANRFTADFVGKINLIQGVCGGCETSERLIAVGATVLRAPVNDPTAPEGAVWVAVRPEHIKLSSTTPAQRNCLAGTIKAKIFVGNQWNVIVAIAGGADWTVEAREDAALYAVGDPVVLGWRARDTVILRA